MFFGAVLWPDDAARRALNEIRRRYDPHVALIDPHITVIFPFETAGDVSAMAEAVAASVSDLQPFPVRLGRMSTMEEHAGAYPEATRLLAGYPNARNVIYLIPETGYEETLDLKRRINSAVDRVDPLVDYPPFLTLGQTLSDTDFGRALAQLAGYHPALQFEAASIDLVNQEADGVWRTIRSVPFRR